jgi:hypothetical protein
MASPQSDGGESLMHITPDDIRVFYERLSLWKAICQNGCQPFMPTRTSWQRCLDSLAFLCDTQTGGKTVSALTVQDGPLGLHYWIACNGEPSSAETILTWLLSVLRSGSTSTDRSLLQKQILSEIVANCSERIQDYHRRLQIMIGMARRGALDEGKIPLREINWSLPLTISSRIVLLATTSKDAFRSDRSSGGLQHGLRFQK